MKVARKKELAASDKGSWFDQPSSDVSGVSHPSTSREVGASSLKLMASKTFTSSLAESDSTSGDESNGSTESEELECEDEPNTWTVVDWLKINSTLQEIASCRLCGDGVLLRCKTSANFVAGRSGGSNFVFHWSAAWPSWQPLWWGVISFQNFRSLKLGLYFCVDFPSSSELIGYVDLTDSYEI